MSGGTVPGVRLFVAVVPGAAVLDALEAAVGPVRAARPELGWVDRERWHVTLAFLGEVPSDRLPALQAELAVAARRAVPMRLGVRGAGRFGDRVLWAGVDGDRRCLRDLATASRAAARRARIPVEGRPFRAHLTLATARPPRSVHAALADLEPLLRSGSDEPIGDTITRSCLVRSTAGRGAGGVPRYETVAAWPLGCA